MISRRLAHDFDSHSMREGMQYFSCKKVKLVRRVGDIVQFSVQGSLRTPYNVFLNCLGAEEDDLIEATCSCPRSEDGRSCKHEYAALLAADGLMDWGPPGTSRLNLAHVMPDEVDFEGEMDDIESESDTFVIPSTATTASRASSVPVLVPQSGSIDALIPAPPTLPAAQRRMRG